MKKWLVMTLLTALFATPAQAKDPCSTVLCMAGLLQGSGVVSGCKGLVNNYFSIIKFNSHGGISLNKTFKARGKFLGKCNTAGNWPGKINHQYGRML
jgi:hypothetical protein